MAIKQSIPEGLSLYPFQVETVEKSLQFLRTKRGVYVANEQGLGKTITSLVTVNSLEQNSKVLIICPAIMRLVWEEEIYKWCRFNSHDVVRVSVINSAKALSAHELENSRFVIVSYQLAAVRAVLTVLCRFKWDVLISDENHFCKNLHAARTKALFMLAGHANATILMSGTPFTTNVVDLFAPCHLLAPLLFPSFNAFAERYSKSTEISVPVKRYGRVQSMLIKKYYGLQNAKELSDIIRENFYIRHRKEDVLKDLPPKIFQKIILPESYSVKLSQKNREHVEAEKQLVIQALEKGMAIPAPHQVANLAEHRRLQGEAKIPAVVEFVADKLDEGIPIVLFAYHHSVINRLEAELVNYKPVVITGDTSNEKRKEAITAFQTGKTLLYIGNILAGGIGVTLTAASTVVCCEYDWVPTTLSQAFDRVHRIGQAHQVHVYWFAVQNSLDEQMDSMIMKRTEEAAAVLDGK